MGRRRTTLVLVVLSMLLMAVSAQGMQLNYKFSVTATEGPLAGVTSAGWFAFNDSIIPVGGGTVAVVGLLSILAFTWHGIDYDETTANTGELQFDSSGNLTNVMFGDDPGPGGVGIPFREEGWYVSNSQFRYGVLGENNTWLGTFSYGLVPGIPGDYDRDVLADIALYRSSTGVWYIYPSGGGAPYGLGWGGNATDKPTPGDYDGDGKTDIAVYRGSTGAWYIYPSGGGAPYAVGWGGDLSDKPVPGDYGGDGETDCAVYRGGVWFIYPSGGGSAYALGWGIATDKPVPGDYDGDGKTDYAVYRNGVWFIYPSGGKPAYAVGWGGDLSDKPVPGDYDGDWMTDCAVYRDGVWFIYPSGGGSPYALEWGMAGDKPVPGYYDGDWKTDIAVYRPTGGVWYIIPSGGASPYGIGWGGDPSDVPPTTNPD